MSPSDDQLQEAADDARRETAAVEARVAAALALHGPDPEDPATCRNCWWRCPCPTMTGAVADRLTARLDEVEALAEAAKSSCGTWSWKTLSVATAPFIDTMSPDRVLALAAATRRVIERHSPEPDPENEGYCRQCSYESYPCSDLTDWAAAWGVE